MPRPIKNPAALAKALDLVRGGMLATEAAEHPDVKGKVGLRTLYDALDRAKGKKPPPRKKPAAAAATPAAASKPASVPPGPPPAAPVVVEEPPQGLSAQERRLWYVERQIGTVRQALAEAEAQKNLARIGPLNEQLRKWLEVHAELQPPAPVDPHEERKKHEQAAASVIAKIKAGIARVTGAAA